MMKKYLVLMFISVLSVKSVPTPHVSSGGQTNFMKEDMQFLASSCPFVEGTAVYRARSIHSYWEPNAVFDDRFLCIQGMNKNQDNSRIDIDSLIESEVISTSSTQQNAILNQANISTSKVKKLIDESSIKIYPNPANAYIMIEYQSTVDGTIRLFNSLGEMVLNTTLSKENTKIQLMLHDLANGIYHYEVEFANMKKTRGKLTILK